MARPDYYDAPECETHERGAPKFCKKSEPGEGAARRVFTIGSANDRIHGSENVGPGVLVGQAAAVEQQADNGFG